MSQLPPYWLWSQPRRVYEATPRDSVDKLVILAWEKTERKSERPFFIRRELKPVLSREVKTRTKRSRESFEPREIHPHANLSRAVKSVDDRPVPNISIPEKVLVLQWCFNAWCLSLQQRVSSTVMSKSTTFSKQDRTQVNCWELEIRARPAILNRNLSAEIEISVSWLEVWFNSVDFLKKICPPFY